MREIKFRGQRLDTKEWVYGYYGLSIDEKHFIIERTFTNDDIMRCYFFDTEVVPETVGQFTGLTDKNGKEIYEGDIAKYFANDNAVIEFRNGSWCVVADDLIDIFGELYASVEVIGNIHENGDLLK